jgi:hypothetical protein
MSSDHREDDSRYRNTVVEGERMIRALEAAGSAWLMFNGALFASMSSADALQLSGRTIDCSSAP